MKQTGHRLIAMLCALCMLFASMPVSVYAIPDAVTEEWTGITAATPTDLDPIQDEEQEIPAEQETEKEAEQQEPVEEETPAEPEEQEETEAPEKETAPEADEEDNNTEPETPEIVKPEADQEVSGYDDITVTGSLKGEKPADYLIRFIPTYSQALCLILTTDGELQATVTDENSGTVKEFIPDEADQNGLTLPYYKVKDDSTYLIRISAKVPVSFSLRLVKMSILKAEQESAFAPEAEPVEVPDEPQAELEAEPQSDSELQTEPGTEPKIEPETEPEAEPEAEPQPEPNIQPEEPVSEPVQEAAEPDPKPAEQASSVDQIVPEPKEQDVPATQTDLEPEPVQEEPVEIRIETNGIPVKANIVFMSDAGIPQDVELQVHELTEEEQAAYQARTVRALKCEDETYLYYTKYLAFTLLSNGEPVELKAPATVSVTLTDVSEGIDALQVVRFGKVGAKLLESEREGDTISFRTNSLAVFGIGNALTPLDTQETELAFVEVLGFSPDAEVSLKETKAPEVEEGLEVLGTFRVEDQTQAAGNDETDGLWIKAELNEDAELAPMESVSLYRVEDGQAEILVEDLSQNSDITELDAQHVAVIKDTGFRYLTLTVNPEEGSEDQTVTLNGMMPKEAEATVVDVTADYADYEYPQDEQQTEEQISETTTEETGETRTTLAAYDISISHPEGEYQPDEDKPISVEILDERITAEGNIELWHIKDDGTKEQVTDFTVETGRITFEATGFSVYAVIQHELDDESKVVTPRVEFHFISDTPEPDEMSDGTHAYYIGSPYSFKNKAGDTQTTQILKQGESLELITDPGNQQTKFFYGWYVVDPYTASSDADEYGIGTADSRLYYTWPAAPQSVSFDDTLSFTETDIKTGDTIHWSLGSASGAGKVDREGTVHVFLAPVFERYNFINFMLYARDVGYTGATSLMTRKLIALGSATTAEVKISDIRSTSKDPVHLLFIGWEYYNEKTAEWVQIQTVEYNGAELQKDGKDGVYLTADLEDTSSIDLYPIFVEARWVDFVTGVSGSGAEYVPSNFRESWGTAGNPPEGMSADSERNLFDSLPVPHRDGYDFDGWYAFARMNTTTGDLTNLDDTHPENVTIDYLDNNLIPRSATVSMSAVKISDGFGRIDYDGSFTVNGYTLFSGDRSVLKLYDPLDRLTLYASWKPAGTKVTIIYWTENAEDDKYTSSAVRTVTTNQLNEVLHPQEPFASGSTLTLNDLKGYTDWEYHVGIVSRDILDDVGAVAEPEEGSQEVPEEIFYDLKETALSASDTSVSDSSVVIKGDGSTVFNAYFSRKIFKLVFHIGRDGYVKAGGNQKPDNTYAGWNGNWLEYMFKDDKVTELGYPKGTGPKPANSYPGVYTMTYLPENKTYTSEYETTEGNVLGNYVPGDSQNDQNLYVIKAKYGAYIGNRWPTPTNPNFRFTNPSGSAYTMYTWAGYYGSRYCYVANNRPGNDANFKNPDLNGVYKYMSAELCANREGTAVINENQVHHIVAYFGRADKADKVKKYHTLYEAVPGTYDPSAVTLIEGTDFSELQRTTWSVNAGVQSTVLDGRTFYQKPAVPDEVISNVGPQYQMAWELDGYTYFYSCYETPVTNDHHVYFFYTPKKYDLTFMYENVEDRKTDEYYYSQSLAEANKYPAPEKEGYEFLGWYTNAAGAGEPFDFANETMPAEGIVLYPVLKALQYTVKIDPNGGEIDHRINPSQSTYFTAYYGTTVGEYNIERQYIKLSEKEQDPSDPTYYDPSVAGQDWYYYINMQYRGESQEGEWGYPTDLRNAIYVKESEIEDYYYNVYCTQIDNADPAWWSGIHKLSLDSFKAKYTSWPYRPVSQGSEHYSFMGWYQVINGSVASMPYNFNEPVKGPVELRAMWRLDGGYYIQYNPYFFQDDGHGNVTVIVGELEQWEDPTNPSSQLYADQSSTHILRAPTNTTRNWVFRGWRVVKANGQSNYTEDGVTKTYTNWEPIEFITDSDGNYVLDENNEKKVKYYQPGDHFTIDSALVSEIQQYGSVIHMQAYYEPEVDTTRRPDVTNLILDANDMYVGGFLNTDDLNDLPELAKPGHSGINTDSELFNGHPTQIELGDFQSNTAIHLYLYATDDTIGSVTGTNFFDNEGPYTLLGFDENADPQNPTTGSPYVPAYAPDSVISVTRNDHRILYAMWEPKIYVTFVNTTDHTVNIELSGNGTSTILVINKVTGRYDREKASKNITLPADGEVMIVLPTASLDPDNTDLFTATAVNTHKGVQMSVRGEFEGTPYGDGTEDVAYQYTTQYQAQLKLDTNGVVVTYSEVRDDKVDFDVNGGTWQEQSTDYVPDNGLYSITAEKIEENQNKYEPAKPTRDGMVFIGWTTDKNIAIQHDFSSIRSVTWGEGDNKTVIHPDEGCNILETLRNPDNPYLWNFDDEPPYEDTLYAVWSEGVTVTFDLRFNSDTTNFHRWTGPELSDTNGSYVFYQDPANPRYVYYTLIKGEKVPQPYDPAAYVASPDAVPDRSFISWLNRNNTTKNLGGQIKKPSDSEIKNNLFDFNKGVTESVTVVTSWSQYVPQQFVFTVKNEVDNGSDEDESTYRIQISGEKVWGKRGTSGPNTNGDSDIHWGYADVTLKNNQQYTVCVTVKYHKPGSWDGCSVEMYVTDSEGNVVKNGLITKANRNGTPTYVGGYLYYLSITQAERFGYDTTVRTESLNGSIAFTTDVPNRQFNFESRWGSSIESSTDFDTDWFPKNPDDQVNGYRSGENNSLTIIFTNTLIPIVAPTGFTSRYFPYVLMLAAGLILMIMLGGMRMRGKQTEEPDEEEAPSTNTDITDTGPPGSGTSRTAPSRTGKRRNTDSKTETMKGDLNLMKKIFSLLLTIGLLTALCTAASADTELTNGVAGAYTEPDQQTAQDKTVRIPKEITVYNPDESFVYGPKITYNYSIRPADGDELVTVTDSADQHASGRAVTETVKPGITGVTMTGTDTNVIEWTNEDILDASVNGTANTKYLTISFASVVFQTPGIYRYMLYESVNGYDAAGVTEGTDNSHQRYLDVYVMRSADYGKDAAGDPSITPRAEWWTIYGYVCIDSSKGKTAIDTNTAKSAGFVDTNTAAGTSTADEYRTYNLTIGKTLTGDNMMTGHQFPFTAEWTGPEAMTGTFRFMVKTNDKADLVTKTSVQAAAAGAAGCSVNKSAVPAHLKVGDPAKIASIPSGGPMIANGGTVKYIGIPNGVKSKTGETNDVAGTTYMTTATEKIGSADAEAVTFTTGTSVTLDSGKTAKMAYNSYAYYAQASAPAAGSNVVLQFTNTLSMISPTGYVARFAPYGLMLIGGIVLLVVAMKRKKHSDEE